MGPLAAAATGPDGQAMATATPGSVAVTAASMLDAVTVSKSAPVPTSWGAAFTPRSCDSELMFEHNIRHAVAYLT